VQEQNQRIEERRRGDPSPQITLAVVCAGVALLVGSGVGERTLGGVKHRAWGPGSTKLVDVLALSQFTLALLVGL
jgi:hypothetical protein